MHKLIKNIRKNHQLTQEEFAKMLYKDQRTISAYETKRAMPTIDFIMSLVNVFDIDLLFSDNKIHLKDKRIMKKQIYEYTSSNLPTDMKLDFIKYDDIVNNYSDRIPSNFTNALKQNDVSTDNVYAYITPDDYSQFCVAIKGNSNSVNIYIERCDYPFSADTVSEDLKALENSATFDSENPLAPILYKEAFENNNNPLFIEMLMYWIYSCNLYNREILDSIPNDIKLSIRYILGEEGDCIDLDE